MEFVTVSPTLACVLPPALRKKKPERSVCDLPLIIVFNTTGFFLEFVENDLIGYYPSIITSLKRRPFVGILVVAKETKALLTNLHEVNIALFKKLSTRKRLPLSLTSQCNPNTVLGPA